MGEGDAAVPEAVVDREGKAWQRRPFARSFDLIAAQYGWTDDQILDLSMARMRQVRAVIWERQAEERRRHLLLKQFELRTLTSFMAQSKKQAKAASEITLVEPDPEPEQPKREPKMIPFEAAQRWFGG